MADYSIDLGISVDTSELDKVKSQINSLENKEIKINLDFGDANKEINNIKKALQGLNDVNGSKNALKLDTSKLESSLGDVKGDITEIKNLLSSIGDGANMKGLASSIGQVGTVLDKVSGKFEELNAEMSALSKKDFSINFNIKAGNSNPVKANMDYGREVRRNTLPALQEQAAYLKEALGGTQEADKALEKYLVKIHKGFGGISAKNKLEDDMINADSLSKQMAAYEKYIGYLKQIALLNGADLNGFNVKFSKTADELINDAAKIQSGAKETEEQFEKLKNVFNSGIDAGNLTKQLDDVVSNLAEIKTTLQGLSSGISFEGLTSSFDKLSNSIESIVKNCADMKTAINSSVGGLSGSVGGSGVENAESDLKEVGAAAKKTSDAIDNLQNKTIKTSSVSNISDDFKEVNIQIRATEDQIDNLRTALHSFGFDNSSIETILKDVKQVGFEIKQITHQLNDDDSIKITVKGVDDLNQAVTAMKSVRMVEDPFDEGNLVPDIRTTTKIAQSFETSADQAKKEAKEVNEAFNEIYSTQKRIGSLEVDLISAEAKNDVKTIETINDEITKLKNNMTSLDANRVYSSRFTDAQKADLKELNELIEYSKKQAQNKVDYKFDLDEAKKEAKEVNEAFEKLKSLAKEMGKIDIKIAGLDASKDADEIRDLTNLASKLEAEYKGVYDSVGKNLDVGQIKELDQIFANTTNAVREVKNEMSKASEMQEFTAGFEKLKSITKEINSLEIEFFKAEDANDVERISAKIDELKNKASALRTELQTKFPNASFDEIDNIAEKGSQALQELVNKANQVKAELAKGIKLDIELGNYDNQISQMDDKFNKLSHASDELRNSVEATRDAYKALENAMNTNTGDEVADAERLIKAQEDYARALEKTNNLIRIQAREEKKAADKLKLEDNKNVFGTQIDAWLKQNSAAVKQFGAAMAELKSQIQSADSIQLNHLKSQFKQLDAAAEQFGVKGLSGFDKMKAKFKEYASYISAAELFSYAERALESMFEQVKLVDAAMTELKKVTNESDASYAAFLDNAGSRAKALGTTIDGLVTSTADFARLGYDFKEAQGLAEVANIYAVVGDDIENVEQATESLISTMSAFKKEMGSMSDSQFAMSIIDVFNELGNKFAISSGGIGEAFERSASSMAAANNTFHETAALITAANTVVQNPEQVGNAMKTKFFNCLYVQKCA